MPNVHFAAPAINKEYAYPRARVAVPIALLLLALAYCAKGYVRPTTYTYQAGTFSLPALVLTGRGPSAPMFAALISRTGGLPKVSESLTLDPSLGREPSEIITYAFRQARLYPVADWEVVRTRIDGGDILALSARGELAYEIEMDFHVQYADGDTALVRWEAWGYGFALGPVALKRDGPAGELYVIERSWEN